VEGDTVKVPGVIAVLVWTWTNSRSELVVSCTSKVTL